MELTELHKKIQAKNVPNFLIFSGDDWAVQQIYIDGILDKYQLEKRYMDTIYDIIPKLGTKAFISKKNCLYIVRDDINFVKDDKMWKRVEELLGDNRLILLITAVDKRLKFFSTYKSTLVEFSALKPANLKKYMQQKIYNLSDKTCDVLIEVCESNYGRILLELDKVIDYWEATNGKLDENKIVYNFLHDGTIYIPPYDAVFDLVDAILDRKPTKAFELYNDCKQIGEKDFIILTNLFNSAKAVLQVQTCESKDVAKSTGLTGWQIMNAKKHLKKYTNKELERILKLINNCVHGIKVGTIDSAFVLDYILVKIL